MKRFFFFISLAVPVLTMAQPADTLVYNPRRAVTLEGTSNFRDLGGYPAANGKTVKWGHIYRSADISKLTNTDLKALESRNIATVCDLRGPDELKTSPDRLPSRATYLNLPAGSEKIQVGANYATMNLDSMMTATYGRTDHLKAKYKPMIDQLLMLDDSQALLFHCTAGKDRTGIGAAIVLSALGVDKTTILKDYQATNEYWKQGRERLAQMLKQGNSDDGKMTRMLTADPFYLESFFKAIDQTYGSMNNFLVTEMELTPTKLTTLQAKYLN